MGNQLTCCPAWLDQLGSLADNSEQARSLGTFELAKRSEWMDPRADFGARSLIQLVFMEDGQTHEQRLLPYLFKSSQLLVPY